MDWFEGFILKVATGGTSKTDQTPSSRIEYPEQTRTLDQVRHECELTDHEYNHIARVMVQSAEVDSTEVRRLRVVAEKQNAKRQAGMDDGPIESFNNFLAFIFCALPAETSYVPSMTEPRRAADPELVFLDGTAASALERSKNQLTEAEYAQILKTQLELAELTEQEERERAHKLKPKRLPPFESVQPKRTPNMTPMPTPSMQAANSTAPSTAQRKREEVVGTESMLSDRIDTVPSTSSQNTSKVTVAGPTPYANLFGFE